MAKAIAIEDSDVEMEDQPKTKKQATEAQEEGDDPQENSSEGEDEEGEPVDEYEIEAILGHKYNMAQFGVTFFSRFVPRKRVAELTLTRHRAG